MYKHNDPCLQKAAADEPIFVLRAQDESAPYIVRLWVAMNAPNLKPETVESALATAAKMQKWIDRRPPD